MNYKYPLKLFVLFSNLYCVNTFATDFDTTLRRIIDENEMRPLVSKPFVKTDKYLLGQALFFDPIISGNRNVSCATCHLFTKATTDALKTSIGFNGIGLGENRKLAFGQLEHPRNSLDLWNRDENSVRSLFWDGEVEVLDPKKRIFRSPFEDKLPNGMENALAIQALIPLVMHDEMLGLAGSKSSDTLPTLHANQPNELANATVDVDKLDAMQNVHNLIMERLIGRKTEVLKPWQMRYRRLFLSANEDKSLDQITIADVGNAIAHFEEIAFATRNAKWDKYLKGDNDAISEQAKRGSILFYKSNSCVNCHNGPLLSDFEFHALGVPPLGPGIDLTGNDLGRYRITNLADDKYKFRTPPLRNVTLTAPYFHNGYANSIEEAINYHFNPSPDISGTELDDARPNLLYYIHEPDSKEVLDLIEFLKTLEDTQYFNIENIIPSSVPSGLEIHRIDTVMRD